MSRQQAEDYVNGTQDDLKSFSEIGQSLIKDGGDISMETAKIDCVNYRYDWETPNLSCESGKAQLQEIGTNEIEMGNCYVSLDKDLGSEASAKISECISDIDALNASYNNPIATSLIDAKSLSEYKNTNIYNKSVLKAALQAK